MNQTPLDDASPHPGSDRFDLGIDLGGTKTEIVVLDIARQPVYRKRVPTPAHRYADVIEMIVQLVGAAEAELGSVTRVGVGIPGAISPLTGQLRNSNTRCLNGQPLREDLERQLRRAVRIENDANCFVLSEAVNGAGSGYPVVFGAIVGTGTGGGIAVDGRLINGPHSISGEWGHNPLPWRRPDDGETDCYCGKSSCIETYLSGPGLAKNFHARFARDLRSEEIIQAARQGDAECAAMLRTYHDQMARALAHVINLLDPHTIILGGGMSNVDSIYREVPRLLASYVFSDSVETPILPAAHGDASGVFGAAMLWD